MPQPRQSPNYWTVISVTAMSKCNKIVPGDLCKNVRVVSTVGLLLSTRRLQQPTAKLLRAPITIVYIRKLPGFLHHSFQTQKTPSTHLPNVCIPSRYQHSEDQLGPLGPSGSVAKKRSHSKCHHPTAAFLQPPTQDLFPFSCYFHSPLQQPLLWLPANIQIPVIFWLWLLRV